MIPPSCQRRLFRHSLPGIGFVLCVLSTLGGGLFCQATSAYADGVLPGALSVLDPYAANWRVEQASFPRHYYHLSLKMKRIYAGGAGEARAVFQQRAKEIMLENGFDAYVVVEYSEGLNSSIFGSQRVADGVIHLTRK